MKSSPFRALRDLLLGARGEVKSPVPDEVPSVTAAPTLHAGGSSAGSSVPERIGPYRILRRLGQGGMGVVFEAHDERLERSVALKTIGGQIDDTAARRFRREAKAAAGVNHPNVCQVYEIGEHAGGLYIVMEMLSGESLMERLRRGALPLAETMPVALGMLSALTALHTRGFVHRDLKPSNVFLTPHGVKLLDFGLARSTTPHATLASTEAAPSELTQPGVMLGTPRYMAPEQVQGRDVDFRADLFALGAVLFEMVAGRPAFGGKTIVEILYATLHEQPPALTGGPAVVAVDRLIRRALAKDPAQRPPSATAMADELRAIPVSGADEPGAAARALTRLVVLPFRVLRPDPDTDFLSYSLADAVSTSLTGQKTLVVRSSAAAARFASESPDLKAIAAEADVDFVLLGTLLRSGDQVRASAQLVEAPAGTLVGAHTVQASTGDVFRLQDELTRRIVESLSLPLAGRDASPRRDIPATPRAYELFLRANELSRDYGKMKEACIAYEACLEEDPNFAPAWARLGRAHRLAGKYLREPEGQARAERAFQRALELNPDLSIAHKLYAHFEAENGRAPQATVRLLERARRDRNDAEIFAGLVHSCRYSGLLEASVAAHEEARRLDPHVPTSLAFTLYYVGDIERLLQEGDSLLDGEPKVFALAGVGRRDEARRVLAEVPLPKVLEIVGECIRDWLDGRTDELGPKLERALELHRDPEAHYMLGAVLAQLGRRGQAIEVFGTMVDRGYFAAQGLARDPLLAPLRDDPAFAAVLSRAERGRKDALAAFRTAGGDELLAL